MLNFCALKNITPYSRNHLNLKLEAKKVQPWVLTIYTNHPEKFEVVGEQTATMYNINQLNRVKRMEKLHPPNLSPCFLKLPNWNGMNHLFFQHEFLDFPCKW